MVTRHDSMVNPRIENLLDKAGSKFTLVTLGATRAREINSYYNRLGDGQGGVPPQVRSDASKPLSIAFEEIAGGHIVGTFEPLPTEDDEPAGSEGDAVPEGG